MPDEKPGVYYAKGDCVGLARRMLVDAIDGFVFLCLWGFAYVVLAITEVPSEIAEKIFLLIVVVISFFYLVLLKYFWLTFGYLIGGVSVVNIRGRKPSFAATCLRAFFLMLGQGNFLLDIFWLSSDPNRQAIRDKFSRTYVIRRGARPAGEGHVRYVQLDILNYHLVLPEVARDDSSKEAINVAHSSSP